MALQKQQVNVNFSKGLDTKSDPWQVPIGNFLNLENTVFNKFGLLEKRKGFNQLASVNNLGVTSLSVFKNELIALGDNLYSFRQQDGTLLNRGTYKPIKVTAQSLIKNTGDEIQVDAAASSNDTACIVYTESPTIQYKYSIVNYKTGQIIVNPTLIPAAGGGAVNMAPRVFSVNGYYIVMYGALVGGTQELQFFAINKNDFTTTAPQTISNDFYRSKASFDAVFANNALYLVWARAAGAGIYAALIDQALNISTPVSIEAGISGDLTAITFDVLTNTLFIAYVDNTTYTARVAGRSLILASVFAPATFATTGATDKLLNVTLSSLSGTCEIIWERENVYSYDTITPTSYIQKRTVTSGGVLGTSPGTTALVRSVGLGAKSFILNNSIYIVAAYQSAQQSGNYLLDLNGNVLAKWAYQNAAGYPIFSLANSTVIDSVIYIPYLIQFFVKAINKDVNDPAPGVFSQLGINMVSIDMGNVPVYSAELGNNLNISGGFLWTYDGALPNENNFFVYPENIEVNGKSEIASITCDFTINSDVVTVSSMATIEPGLRLFSLGNTLSGPVQVLEILSPTTVRVNYSFTATAAAQPTFVLGNLSAQTYSYTSIYEWTDNQGNIINSAPSIPVEYTVNPANELWTSSFTANTSTGSNLLRNISAFTNLQVGQQIRGAGIPANTYIVAINTSATTGTPSIQISANATATAAGVTIFYYPITTTTTNIPTLRLTYKPGVLIRLYRYSAQQQVSHLTNFANNNKAVDFVSIIDPFSDIYNSNRTILYTNNGVENTSGPPSGPMTIWDNRLWVLDTEEPNTIWYSKIVSEGVSCEMTDLFTRYINPTNSAQGSTSPVTTLSVMDDKLIVFKKDAIYYINGVGPDNFGTNSQFSEPILITSTVGTALPDSVCVIPDGLLFQSDKGIWLVSRSGQTAYLGAAVEQFTQAAVCTSASIVPETNQARFVMNDGTILMYDYFFQQWGRFTGLYGRDSVIYNSKQTLLDNYQRILIQSDNGYQDAGNPVLMKFKTSWFALSGILGFQRAYFVFFLGQYYSPHKLIINVAYDFNPNATQQLTVTPDNYASVFGGDPLFGSGYTFGGPSQVERWRLMLEKQKCDSVQFEFIEQYDPTYGVSPGAGLTLSGLNFIVGLKKGYGTISQFNTVG